MNKGKVVCFVFLVGWLSSCSQFGQPANEEDVRALSRAIYCYESSGMFPSASDNNYNDYIKMRTKEPLGMSVSAKEYNSSPKLQQKVISHEVKSWMKAELFQSRKEVVRKAISRWSTGSPENFYHHSVYPSNLEVWRRVYSPGKCEKSIGNA